jgi:hypothetical protein
VQIVGYINTNLHFIFSNFLPIVTYEKIFYEKIWENMVESDKLQMATQYGKCTVYAGQLEPHTHTEYVIIIGFPR